jgi:uncharacterized integral membrane protein
MYSFLITFLLIVFFAVAFSLQNSEPVILNFFSWRFQGSLVVVLLTALACGIILSAIASLPSFIKKSRLIAQQQKTIAQLKQAATEVPLEQTETEDKQLSIHQDVL